MHIQIHFGYLLLSKSKKYFFSRQPYRENYGWISGLICILEENTYLDYLIDIPITNYVHFNTIKACILQKGIRGLVK